MTRIPEMVPEGIGCKRCGRKSFSDLTTLSLGSNDEQTTWLLRRCSARVCRGLQVLRESRSPAGARVELMEVPRSYSDKPASPARWRIVARLPISSGRGDLKKERPRGLQIRG